MSLAIDSPLPDSSGSSSSSDHVDDFAGFLDEVLDSDSDDEVGSIQSTKRRKVEVNSDGSSAISITQVLELQKVEKMKNANSLCEHLSGSYKDMCLICGERLDQNENENEKSELEELRVNSCSEIDQRKRNSNTKELLLRHKKLHLVLDLDHTLLNSTAVGCMTPQERYLLEPDHSMQGVFVVKTPVMHLMTKLRPFVGTFLKEASDMFEMSIYTMGDRFYAQQMVKLLDPRNEYFGDRVVSRDDSTRKFEKNLDVVCAKESAVLVLDDTQQVWTEQNQDNVILMRKYMFFKHSYDTFGLKYCTSHSELKTDDEQPQGAYLAAILELLKRIHGMFFDDEAATGDNLVDRDVRQVLKSVRNQVLKGCKIAFGCVLASETKADLWNMAEKLGAACSTQVMDPSVTHVIETDGETQNSQWASKENQFLVHPQWIQAANFMWQNQPEDMFSIS